MKLSSILETNIKNRNLIYHKDNYDMSRLPDNLPDEVDQLICFDNELTTLEGCPKRITGNFACAGNKLSSLKGCAEYVGKSFSCYSNIITSLEGLSIRDR